MKNSIFNSVTSLFSRNKPNRSTDIVPAKAPSRKAAALSAIMRYHELDPKFDERAFLQKVANLYVRFHAALTQRDISELEPYCTPEFFADCGQRVEQWKQEGCTPHADRLCVLTTSYAGYCREDGFDCIITELRTRSVNYFLSDKDNKVLFGSKTEEKFRTIRMELVRKAGEVSLTELEAHVTNCPSCGAPVNLSYSSKCSFCGGIADKNEHGFVIRSIKSC